MSPDPALLDVPEPHGIRDEFRAMLRLALPVVVVQVGMMAMGFTDTVMVGRVSSNALASVALGNVYVWGAIIFGIGVLMALDPVVAQAVGAKDTLGVSRGLQRGVVMAVVLTVPASLLLLTAAPVLALLRQPGEITPVAATYAVISAAGVLPFYIFVVLRQSLQAMHRLAPIVWVIALANGANVLLNWAFIFGHLGLPPMGAIGSAWATVLSRWIMAALLLWMGRRELGPHLSPWRAESLERGPLKRMFALGAPIGVQHQLEYGVFGVVGILMGWIGPVAMAGHQVALNLASLTFMVPLGVSAAAAVLVGHAIGRGELAEARRAALAAVTLGVSFMVVSAAAMIGAPDFFARVYTDKAEVIAVAVVLIPLAGVFQVFDGLQVVCIGILRGAGDTRAPMLVAVIGFWCVGVPTSWLLGFRTDLGMRGLWWGLVAGLVVVSLILLARVRHRLAREVARIVIDRSGEEAALPGRATSAAPP
jgi:MATE family multidrug resistance protein